MSQCHWEFDHKLQVAIRPYSVYICYVPILHLFRDIGRKLPILPLPSLPP